MMGIGIVLMVSGLYGSYGWAGAVVASNAVAWAVGNAVLSNLVDRFGQRRVMLPAAMVSNATLLLLVVAGVRLAPIWVLFIPSILCGLTGGSPGAMVRARWNHVVRGPQQLHTAFSLESTLDELTFIVGPVAAAWLATSIHPAAGLVVPAGLSTVGAVVFYHVLRATEPPPRERVPGVRPPRQRFVLAIGGAAVVVAVTVCIGMSFGSIDVSVVAATSAWEARDRSGLVLAAFSAGSAIAGLGYGLRAWVWPVWKRFVTGVVVFALLVTLLLVAQSVGLLAVCGFIVGFAVAPTLVNSNSLMGNLVPLDRLTEGLAWVGTSLGIGVSIGSSVAGQFIDAYGHRAGFLTALSAVCLAAVVALAGAATLRRRTQPGAVG